MSRAFVLLSALSALSLAACGAPSADDPSDPGDPEAPAPDPVDWTAVQGSCSVDASAFGTRQGQGLGGTLLALDPDGEGFLSLDRGPDGAAVATRWTLDGAATPVPFANPHHAGWSLTPAGADVDGDGRDDLFAVAPQGSTDDDIAVSDPDATLPHLLLSGRDLSVLADLSDVVGYDLPAGSAGIADVDGDARPEVLVQEDGFFSAIGLDGRLHWTLDLGPDAGSTWVAGDLDGDGAADLLSTTWEGVRALTTDGAVLWEADIAWATTLHPMGDLDGDGVDDFLVAYAQDGNGVVEARSGATADLLWVHDYDLDGMPASSTGFGTDAVALGDQNGDGVDELLISGDNDTPDRLITPYGGVVAVLDGATGAALVDLQAHAPETGDAVIPHSLAPHFGSAILPLGGDGLRFLVGAAGHPVGDAEDAGAWMVFHCQP